MSYNKNINVNNNIYNKNIYKDFRKAIVTEIAEREACIMEQNLVNSLCQCAILTSLTERSGKLIALSRKDLTAKVPR